MIRRLPLLLDEILTRRAAVSLIGFLIGTIRATLILRPRDLALCVYCYYYTQRPFGSPSPPTLCRRFSLDAAFFTADYVCGYRVSLSLSLVFLAANSLPWFTGARCVKMFNIFSAAWLNNLQTPYSSRYHLYPLVMYTRFLRLMAK